MFTDFIESKKWKYLLPFIGLKEIKNSGSIDEVKWKFLNIILTVLICMIIITILNVHLGVVILISSIPILFVIGILKPSRLIKWGNPDRGDFAITWVGYSILMLVISAIITPPSFTIKTNPNENELTTANEIIFTLTGNEKGSMAINTVNVPIQKKEFTLKLPLNIGKNEFKIIYKFEEKVEEKVITINRLTEQELKNQKDKIEKEAEVAKKKDEIKKNKIELENRQAEEQTIKNNKKAEQELARAIHRETKELIKKGFNMERLRSNANLTSKCMEIMQNLILDISRIDMQASNLPLEYIRLKTIVSDTNLCIRCNSAAIDHCKIANSDINKLNAEYK